ncbi:NAD(P)/FAD-dependent oxidoreductase, partial [Burkholderia pseudomallei]
MPSLIGLETMEDVYELNKLSLRNVAIKVMDKRGKNIFEDFGEMEFNEFGIDGPIIKSASCRMKSFENETYKIYLDLKPALSEETLDKRIQKDFKKYTNKKFENSLDDLLPKKLIPYVIKQSGIDKDLVVHQISKEQRKHLVNLLKNMEFNIKRYRPIDE